MANAYAWPNGSLKPHWEHEMHKFTLMWFIIASDDAKGIGIGIPYWNGKCQMSYMIYHQETLGA